MDVLRRPMEAAAADAVALKPHLVRGPPLVAHVELLPEKRVPEGALGLGVAMEGFDGGGVVPGHVRRHAPEDEPRQRHDPHEAEGQLPPVLPAGTGVAAPGATGRAAKKGAESGVRGGQVCGNGAKRARAEGRRVSVFPSWYLIDMLMPPPPRTDFWLAVRPG